MTISKYSKISLLVLIVALFVSNNIVQASDDGGDVATDTVNEEGVGPNDEEAKRQLIGFIVNKTKDKRKKIKPNMLAELFLEINGKGEKDPLLMTKNLEENLEVFPFDSTEIQDILQIPNVNLKQGDDTPSTTNELINVRLFGWLDKPEIKKQYRLALASSIAQEAMTSFEGWTLAHFKDTHTTSNNHRGDRGIAISSWINTTMELGAANNDKIRNELLNVIMEVINNPTDVLFKQERDDYGKVTKNILYLSTDVPPSVLNQEPAPAFTVTHYNNRTGESNGTNKVTIGIEPGRDSTVHFVNKDGNAWNAKIFTMKDETKIR